MPDKPIETKQAILNAEQLAIKQARQEREAAVKDAKQLEQDTCRNVIAAGENLKQQLKKARGKDEKTALKQAVKEAESAGRQTISRAKKNSETQVRIALEQEKESIRRAKADKEQALKSLKAQAGAGSESGDELRTPPGAGDLQASPAGIDPANPEPVQEPAANEIQHQTSEEKTPPGQTDDTVTKPIESPAGENPEAGEEGRRSSGYDDILRSLEEIGRKLEESRKARSELHAGHAENSTTAEILQVQPPESPGEAPAGTSDEAIAQPAQPERAVQEQVAAAGEPLDEPAVQPEAEKAGLFEGRVRILVQNPSSLAVKTLGEKLKRIEDVKMLLFGGSADEGIQIIVMVLKPIPLVERIEQAGQVEIVSYTPNEITLRFKT